VPNERSTCTIRKEENPAGMRDCGWRDPDSNREHHDFQSWSKISLTSAESLQIRQFMLGDGGEWIAANCGRLSLILALRHDPVPNQHRSASAGVLRRPGARG
jgi:hypothetical protein